MAKTRLQGLICEEAELPGARSEETRDLNIIIPNLQGSVCKIRGLGLRVRFEEKPGAKSENKGLPCKYF